ncbi:inactive pancreatic lipase-related protein 1-like [Limosa lapponica baueri]|uniref:Triacylglycerol lipase n=1 Tax=Limosa lapponica baueri TaxID=1758121 RepID=A0A2I0TKA2_LIMLA|nr:inactive pancreatic lipase-related protein 1-like [Limosa lapponica baueri]
MPGIWILALFLLSAAEGEEVCYDRLGCFSDDIPWSGTTERPIHKLPWDPKKIDVHFLLYTRENPDNFQEISAVDTSTIEYSNFNASRLTRFIVHGFIDNGEENWLSDMCKGSCFPCPKEGCPNMGHFADKFKGKTGNDFTKLYLNTAEDKDFALWRYKVTVTLSGKSKVKGYVNVALYGSGGNTRQHQVIQGTLQPDNTYTSFIDAEVNVGTVTKVKFLWNNNWINPTLPKLGAATITVQSGENGTEYRFCGSEKVREDVLQTLTAC